MKVKEVLRKLRMCVIKSCVTNNSYTVPEHDNKVKYVNVIVLTV